MKTIAVTERVYIALKELKEKLSLPTYSDVIEYLIRRTREAELKEALSVLELDDTEAENLKRIISERREHWWKR